MITVEKVSFSYADRELYKNVSFTLNEGQHCAFIGSNGTGKTTLLTMLMHTEDFLYEGKITKEEHLRIGCVSQVEKSEKEKDVTVFEFLSEAFVENQEENARLCTAMAEAGEEALEELYEAFQKVVDAFSAMDGEHYESNIRKQLKTAGLSKLEHTELAKLSGGEFKLVQIIRQMLMQPELLIMDEPDVFLDFDNLNGLCDLINTHKGTLLVVTHNRYLLNHCFNKILHLENADIQEYDGSYAEYNLDLLLKKIELQELAAKDKEEIERTRKMVDRLRLEATRIDSAQKGRSLKAKATQLKRLEARQIKEPFVHIRQPEIVLPQAELPEKEAGKVLLSVQDYQISFEELLLENVSFELHEGEKLAIAGANGTGKTTLLRDIYRNAHPAIRIFEEARIGFLSQIHGEMLNEGNTVYQEMEEAGVGTRAEIAAYLEKYCFTADRLNDRIEVLSGGEKNLLQLAKLSAGNANLLLLDEPTSHLDTYAQLALERAVAAYKGAVLMVSHDFYSIVNCADSVLFVEGKTIRKMRTRSFRKMIYEKYFSKTYLELEQQKKQLEMRIESLLKVSDYEKAKALGIELENIVERMRC